MKQHDGADVATSNGGPPNPPTPAPGVDVASSDGGTPPQTPHSHARGGCHLFEWGTPPNPPTPALGVDVASSKPLGNGGPEADVELG